MPGDEEILVVQEDIGGLHGGLPFDVPQTEIAFILFVDINRFSPTDMRHANPIVSLKAYFLDVKWVVFPFRLHGALFVRRSFLKDSVVVGHRGGVWILEGGFRHPGGEAAVAMGWLAVADAADEANGIFIVHSVFRIIVDRRTHGLETVETTHRA